MMKYDYTFKALWTTCIISIARENDIWLNTIINNIYNKTIAFQSEFSRFDENSTLSKLNKLKTYEVSDDFMSLLLKSKDIYKLTNWFFNPLIDVRKIWYSHNFTDNNFEIIDNKEDLNIDNIKIFWSKIVIDENMNIDFWSIAKWYLADKIGNYLEENWIRNYIANFGWDIYAWWLNQNYTPWQIWINSPINEEEIVYVVWLSNNSVSTSWIYLRNWQINNKSYHHIRNPFSDIQSNKLQSVSIKAKYWYLTDALATSVIAMWYDLALEFCNKNNIEYLFILDDWKIIKSDNF